MSDSLQPHGLQHGRPPCSLPSPGVCPSSCSFHQWCHPTISLSDALVSFCCQSFPASRTFPMSHLFASDDQNTGVSASACPSIEYSGLISLKIDLFNLLAVQGTFGSLLQHHSLKATIWTFWFFKYLFMYLFIWLGQVLVATCRIEGSLPSLQSGSRNLMRPLERP